MKVTTAHRGGAVMRRMLMLVAIALAVVGGVIGLMAVSYDRTPKMAVAVREPAGPCEAWRDECRDECGPVEWCRDQCVLGYVECSKVEIVEGRAAVVLQGWAD